MDINFMVLLGAALVPLIIGFIWYNPKVFGNAWMQAADMTEEKIKGGNMALIFSLSYVLSIFMGLALYAIVIHQFGVFSLVGGDADLFTTGTAKAFMDEYGTNFRTFKHGAFHGVIDGLLLIMPIMATNAMFERKGFKYIAVNTGYWIVTLALMGGVICQWG